MSDPIDFAQGVLDEDAYHDLREQDMLNVFNSDFFGKIVFQVCSSVVVGACGAIAGTEVGLIGLLLGGFLSLFLSFKGIGKYNTWKLQREWSEYVDGDLFKEAYQ